jgi:hypothetical protein
LEQQRQLYRLQKKYPHPQEGATDGNQTRPYSMRTPLRCPTGNKQINQEKDQNKRAGQRYQLQEIE